MGGRGGFSFFFFFFLADRTYEAVLMEESVMKSELRCLREDELTLESRAPVFL